MTSRAWAAIGVLAALVVVMVVMAVRLLPGHHDGSDDRADSVASSAEQTGNAPAPAPASGTPAGQQSDEDTGGDGGGTVLSAADVTAAHQAMTGYLQSLGSYTYSDRQSSWQRAALTYTDGGRVIKAFTHLPTGRAWASCQHTHCTSQSKARVLHDTATTNVAGSGGGPQVVSYVDLTTQLRSAGHGSTQHTQFTITATEDGGDWKVSGCTFAGVGDQGANGDGP